MYGVGKRLLNRLLQVWVAFANPRSSLLPLLLPSFLNLTLDAAACANLTVSVACEGVQEVVIEVGSLRARAAEGTYSMYVCMYVCRFVAGAF